MVTKQPQKIKPVVANITQPPEIADKTIIIDGKQYPIRNGKIEHGGKTFTYMDKDALEAAAEHNNLRHEGNLMTDGVPWDLRIECKGSLMLLGKNTAIEKITVSEDLIVENGEDPAELRVRGNISAKNIHSKGRITSEQEGIHADDKLNSQGTISANRSITASSVDSDDSVWVLFGSIDVGSLKAKNHVHSGEGTTSKSDIVAYTLTSNGKIIAEKDIKAININATGRVESKKGDIEAKYAVSTKKGIFIKGTQVAGPGEMYKPQ